MEGCSEQVLHVFALRSFRLREIHRLSQRAAATRIGISGATLSRIENERFTDIRWSVVEGFCREFEVSPNYLLGYDPFRPAVGTCPKCGGKVEGDPHTLRQCIMSMHRQGRRNAYVAQEFDLTIRSIEFIIREEFSVVT